MADFRRLAATVVHSAVVDRCISKTGKRWAGRGRKQTTRNNPHKLAGTSNFEQSLTRASKSWVSFEARLASRTFERARCVGANDSWIAAAIVHQALVDVGAIANACSRVATAEGKNAT